MENKDLELLKTFEVEELEDRMEFELWAPEPCYEHTYTTTEYRPVGMTDGGLGISSPVTVEKTVTICPD
jgi:hypothetical protein